MRIAANDSLKRDIAELLPRPVGRPSIKPLVEYKSFLYQAASWKKARRVVAKARQMTLRQQKPVNLWRRLVVPKRIDKWSGCLHRWCGVSSCCPCQRDRPASERAHLSDERATDKKVSERSVERGIVPSLRSLRGAEIAPLCGPWRQAAMLTRLTVAFDAGQMYAAERRRSPKWNFRFKCIRGRSGTRWPPGRCGSGERCKRKGQLYSAPVKCMLWAGAGT
jgi:hypothetical protein